MNNLNNNQAKDLHKIIDGQIKDGNSIFIIECDEKCLEEVKGVLKEHERVSSVIENSVRPNSIIEITVTIRPLPPLEVSYDEGQSWQKA